MAWMGLNGQMMSWTAVIPVKRLDSAKSRLTDVGDPRRPELALAFFQDVLIACQSAPSIGLVVVVTDDAEVIACSSGALMCPEPEGGGLNQAMLAGAALAQGPVVALAGDLPSLTPGALEYVLSLASSHQRSLLSDTQGSGTAMLLCHDNAVFDPHFGFKSRSSHVQFGYSDLALDAPADIRSLLAGARRDVDTPADLWDALRIGVGPNTSEVLGRQP